MSSNHQTYTSYTSTSYTSSSSTTSADGTSQPHTKSYTETANYDSRTGGNVVRESRESGQPTIREHTEVPVRGQVTVSSGDGEGRDGQRRIEDVTEQEDADQRYLERMEEEYAKREGGA